MLENGEGLLSKGVDELKLAIIMDSCRIISDPRYTFLQGPAFVLIIQIQLFEIKSRFLSDEIVFFPEPPLHQTPTPEHHRTPLTPSINLCLYILLVFVFVYVLKEARIRDAGKCSSIRMESFLAVSWTTWKTSDYHLTMLHSHPSHHSHTLFENNNIFFKK